VPAFYSPSNTIDDLVNHTVRRVLDLFGIHSEQLKRWPGIKAGASAAPPQEEPL
jgi:3-polyprenyl-4-hydroxybenzoate decarboxylase